MKGKLIMADLSLKVRETLFNKGTSLIGFANLKKLPEGIRYSLPYAISIAVPLNHLVIKNIGKGPTKEYYNEYLEVNNLLSYLGKCAADILTQTGYSAIPLEPTTENFDPLSLETPLPHKTVATRAGLGWIGKSALLVTREYGSAVRLTTILTDADLETGIPVDNSQCGECMVCVNLCPSKAILGKNWMVEINRDSFFNAGLCRERAKQYSESIGIEATICGICIAVCPWTIRYGERETNI